MEKAGKNRSDYKKVNRGLALKMVAIGQCTTRSDLVRYTGLSKMAISNIVSAMLAQDYLIETGVSPSEELGRRPTGLAISPKAPKTVGLVVHRNRVDAVLCDLNLTALKRESLPISEDVDKEKLMALVFQALDTVMEGTDNIVAIGLSSIGPISIAEGKILKPYYFYGIENVNIVAQVKEHYGLPVFFDHDNQSAVLAESLYGNARNHSDVLFIGIGQGVGCGILADNKLYCNSRGLPPELGHVSIDVNGRVCACGNRGCVEAYIRSPELVRRMQYHTRRSLSLVEFGQMEDDEMVNSIFNDAVNRLATAIVSIVNMLNSELILLGNDAIYWPDRHIAELEALINERRFVEWSQPIQVRRSYFMQDAALMGAACNAISHIFQGELIFEDL